MKKRKNEKESVVSGLHHDIIKKNDEARKPARVMIIIPIASVVFDLLSMIETLLK